MIQISTVTDDYILDILSLKTIIKPYLKEIFENPDVIKIFYAGDNDLAWLQRDFYIIVNNYFDVKMLASLCNKNIDCSLANLIETYCEKGKMDKKQKKLLQISPWWKRPLSEEQLNYAALDSHYLIYLREKLLTIFFEKVSDCKKILSFFLKLEEVTKKTFSSKEFNKFEFYETFNKLLKSQKQTTIIEKPNNEEEKKLEKEDEKKLEKEDDKKFPDKKYMQFYFIKLAELRDIKAREKDIGVEEMCPNNFLFELSKEISFKNIDEIIKSENYPKEVKEFLISNLAKVQEILSFDKAAINNEISLIISSQKNTMTLEKSNRKKERQKQIEEMFMRKSPAYDNCSILAPDGFLLWFFIFFIFKIFFKKSL